ncbi:uncharacterized protein PGTG_17963 [Puccinia graminis f. sp. tritici CRL 75-36-700-3]|uniref:Uncharacterized protein n=1 Tax=Puccinia graminis f. sp. tritici (strain CRL 75-36-700-3 / race SCCL) TaxID=418459 RepID=E3L5W1_PUCGT|nr:uncharacterized protein PGTG_17963 [Puccinia graminis f. sp. tritici CRL 75-36-700-3]EFP91936.1 hypothetical protein PGTG_17963 [Puccinia graminis f. sp. tritici CRL 75-36-700-3]
MTLADHIAGKKAADKVHKAADRAENKLAKAAAKTAQVIIKKTQAPKTTRLTWSEDVSLKMVHFYGMVKDEHTELKRDQPGFMNFNKFFLAYPVDCDLFPLLVGRNNQSLLTRYAALMGTWRKVRDNVDRSGSDGLFVALIEFGMSEAVRPVHHSESKYRLGGELTLFGSSQLWNLLGNMHGNNAAAHAHGQVGLEDPIKRILDYSALPQIKTILDDSASPRNSASELPNDPLAEPSPEHIEVDPTQSTDVQTEPIPRQSVRRNRRNLPPLTEAELALDSPSPPPAYERAPATQPTRLTPSRVTVTGTTGAISSASGSGVSPSTQRPPAESAAPTRQRGRYEEAPKKEDPTANGMLLLMHRSEEARLKERREVEARFNRKEEAQLEALREDRRERDEATQQLRLDRELAAAQMRLDKEAADGRASARARETQEATRRWEAHQERLASAQVAQQAAQEESCQAFQLAILKLMGGGQAK